MTEDAYISVFIASNELQAVMHRQLLEEAGMSVIEQRVDCGYPVGMVPVHGMYSRLLVREEDGPHAVQLIAAYADEVERGNLTLADDEE